MRIPMPTSGCIGTTFFLVFENVRGILRLNRLTATKNSAPLKRRLLRPRKARLQPPLTQFQKQTAAVRRAREVFCRPAVSKHIMSAIGRFPPGCGRNLFTCRKTFGEDKGWEH
jgi:hypothetical protein